MATVAVIVGAAMVNAIAFTTGNALYDKFGKPMDLKKELGMTELLKIYEKHLHNEIRSN